MHKKLEALDDATKALIQKEIDNGVKADRKRITDGLKDVEVPEDRDAAKIHKAAIKAATAIVKDVA